MPLGQPALDRPLLNPQSLGNGPCWKTFLSECEHLLIASFTRRLARAVCWHRGRNSFGRQLSFACRFGYLFPAGGNDFIEVPGQILGEAPTIGHLRGLQKCPPNTHCKLTL